MRNVAMPCVAREASKIDAYCICRRWCQTMQSGPQRLCRRGLVRLTEHIGLNLSARVMYMNLHTPLCGTAAPAVL